MLKRKASINLLSALEKDGKDNIFYIIGAIVVFIFLIFNIRAYLKVVSMEKGYQKTIEQNEDIIKKYNLGKIKDEIKYIQSLSRSVNFSWSKFLSDLEKQIPKQLSLTTITPSFMEGKVRVKINGMAIYPVDIYKFMENLKASKHFSDPVSEEQSDFINPKTKEISVIFNLVVDYKEK